MEQYRLFVILTIKMFFFCKVEMLFLDEAGFFRVYQLSEHVKGWSCSRRFSGSSPAQDSQRWAELRQSPDFNAAFLLATLPPHRWTTDAPQAPWARDSLLGTHKILVILCCGRGRGRPQTQREERPSESRQPGLE